MSVLGRTAGSLATTPNTSAYGVDVGDGPALRTCLDEAVDRGGKVSCLVFLQRHRGTADEFDKDLAVSLSGSRVAVEHLTGRKGFADGPATSIVFVSSIADRYVAPEQSAGYHVAKAGLSQLARFYALQLGPAGIRVNMVSPCVVAKDAAGAFYEKNAWLVDRYKRFVPLGRMGRSQDIVNAIMFLASEQAAYITGQNLVVDGGLTLRSHESLIRECGRE